MNDSKTEQLETAIGRLQSQERRAAIDRGYIRSRLDPKVKATGTGTGSLEYVVLSSHTGTAGDESIRATFMYTFTDAAGITHTNVSPAHQRPLGTQLFATIGIWDNIKLKLVWTDEEPDTTTCSTSAPVLQFSSVPFFGF